jgi:hypothetical protein
MTMIFRKHLRARMPGAVPPGEAAMARESKIEWSNATWNPIAGCSLVSPGRTNCYTARMVDRLRQMGIERYQGPTGACADPAETRAGKLEPLTLWCCRDGVYAAVGPDDYSLEFLHRGQASRPPPRWPSAEGDAFGLSGKGRGLTAHYIKADAAEGLKDIPRNSINCVVTSPPIGACAITARAPGKAAFRTAIAVLRPCSKVSAKAGCFSRGVGDEQCSAFSSSPLMLRQGFGRLVSQPKAHLAVHAN